MSTADKQIVEVLTQIEQKDKIQKDPTVIRCYICNLQSHLYKKSLEVCLLTNPERFGENMKRRKYAREKETSIKKQETSNGNSLSYLQIVGGRSLVWIESWPKSYNNFTGSIRRMT